MPRFPSRRALARAAVRTAAALAALLAVLLLVVQLRWQRTFDVPLPAPVTCSTPPPTIDVHAPRSSPEVAATHSPKAIPAPRRMPNLGTVIRLVVGLGLPVLLVVRLGAGGVVEALAGISGPVVAAALLLGALTTVAGAARSVARLKPTYLTVHAVGGAAMVRAAVEAAPDVAIAAVTVLTAAVVCPR